MVVVGWVWNRLFWSYGGRKRIAEGNIWRASWCWWKGDAKACFVCNNRRKNIFRTCIYQNSYWARCYSDYEPVKLLIWLMDGLAPTGQKHQQQRTVCNPLHHFLQPSPGPTSRYRAPLISSLWIPCISSHLCHFRPACSSCSCLRERASVIVVLILLHLSSFSGKLLRSSSCCYLYLCLAWQNCVTPPGNTIDDAFEWLLSISNEEVMKLQQHETCYVSA